MSNIRILVESRTDPANRAIALPDYRATQTACYEAAGFRRTKENRAEAFVVERGSLKVVPVEAHELLDFCKDVI